MDLSALFLAAGLPYGGAGKVLLLSQNGRNATENSLVCLGGDGAECEAVLAYRRGARCFFADRPLPLPADATVTVSCDYPRELAALSAAFYGMPHRRMELIGVCGGRNGRREAGLILRLMNACGRRCGAILEDGYQVGDRRVLYTEHPIGPKELFHGLSELVAKDCDCAVIHLPSHALVRGWGEALFLSALIYHGEAGYEALLSRPSAKIVVCREADREQFSGSLIKTFGAGGDVCLREQKCGREGTVYALSDGAIFSSHLRWEAGADTVAAALSAATSLGVPLTVALGAMGRVTSLASLEELAYEKGVLYLMDDAFDPAEAEAALRVARSQTGGRLIAVAGCVGMRNRERRVPVGLALGRYAHRVYLTADDPGFEPVSEIAADMMAEVTAHDIFTVVEDRTEAIRQAVREARPGDTVLLLGKGYEPCQEIGSRWIPYAERDALMQVLRENRQK